jgi:hypothetical protein
MKSHVLFLFTWLILLLFFNDQPWITIGHQAMDNKTTICMEILPWASLAIMITCMGQGDLCLLPLVMKKSRRHMTIFHLHWRKYWHTKNIVPGRWGILEILTNWVSKIIFTVSITIN